MKEKFLLLKKLFLFGIFFIMLSGLVLSLFPKLTDAMKTGLPSREEWKKRTDELILGENLSNLYYATKADILSCFEWFTDGYAEEKGKKIFPFLVSCDAFLPCDYNYISSDFGKRVNPLSFREEYHQGLDLAIAEGKEIRAGWPGIIKECGFDKIYGNYIIITHSDGFESKYAHLSKIDGMEGIFVHAGEKIGEAGKTGWATGSHLHFEVMIQGQNIDPKEYLSLC